MGLIFPLPINFIVPSILFFFAFRTAACWLAGDRGQFRVYLVGGTAPRDIRKLNMPFRFHTCREEDNTTFSIIIIIIIYPPTDDGDDG